MTETLFQKKNLNRNAKLTFGKPPCAKFHFATFGTPEYSAFLESSIYYQIQLKYHFNLKTLKYHFPFKPFDFK